LFRNNKKCTPEHVIYHNVALDMRHFSNIFFLVLLIVCFGTACRGQADKDSEEAMTAMVA
jgi:hypothetical protein